MQYLYKNVKRLTTAGVQILTKTDRWGVNTIQLRVNIQITQGIRLQLPLSAEKKICLNCQKEKERLIMPCGNSLLKLHKGNRNENCVSASSVAKNDLMGQRALCVFCAFANGLFLENLIV